MATKKKNKYLESINKSADKIESNKEKYAQKEEYNEEDLFGRARKNISQNRLRESNNIGESPYKNLSIIRANKQKEEEEARESIFDIARNNIASGAASYKRAEKSYMDSLPNDAYRNAYTYMRDNNVTSGVYSSPYFSKGIEGKEKLTYNNAGWNNLSEGERKGYLEWAQQELEKEAKKTGVWQEPNGHRDNKYLNYAMAIVNETDDILYGDYVDKADTFNADQEVQIMFQTLPDDVKKNLLKSGNLSDEMWDYLEKTFGESTASRLAKYGEHVGDIQRQEERNSITETLMKNPIYATIVAPTQSFATDVFVKPMAGYVDALRSESESNKGIYGEFNPLETGVQKLAQDARYVNQSINEGLSPVGQFIYNTSMSAGESAFRAGLANLGGSVLSSGNAELVQEAGAAGLSKFMPFVDSESASKTILTVMMGTAVFNDSLNESIQKGMPLEDAVSSAFAHSVFEALFEELSLDKLGYFDEAPVLRTKKEFLKQLLKAGFVEGTEEAFTDIANELYDHYVGNYDFSEYKAFKDNYLAQNPNATDAEIWWEFTKQFSWQVAQSFAGGALSSFALSSTKGMDALRRGEVYVQNGKNVSDADYARMNAFVEEMAAVNPSIMNQLAEASEGGLEARKGFVKMVVDEYSDMFNREIEQADSKNKLNTIMTNANAVLNGEISENTFNKYNAKLIELGETPADYNTFVQNRAKTNADTTFSDLAYGKGDNAISRNIVEASKSIANAKKNATMTESERDAAIKKLTEKVDMNVKKAEEMVARYAEMGVPMDSPEVRQFESVIGLQDMAQVYSAGKLAAELKTKNAPTSTKKSGVVTKLDLSEAKEIFEDKAKYIVPAEMDEISKIPEYQNAYRLGQVIAKMTGANVKLYKSMRVGIQNGAFSRERNTIYIDVAAGESGAHAAIGEAFSHELTHWLRANNEAGYQNLLTFVRTNENFDTLVKDRIEQSKRMKEKNNGKGRVLSEDEAQEEIVAQACQKMLQDSETFKKYAAQDLEGAKTILQRLLDFIRAIRDAFKGSLNNDATRILGRMEGLAEEWEKALKNAIGENEPAAVKEAMEGKENIAEVERNKDGDMTIAKMADRIMYSETTYRNGGRMAIVDALREKGYSAEDIAKVTDRIDRELDYIKNIGDIYASQSFSKLAENLQKDVTYGLADEQEMLDRIEASGVLSQEVINNLRAEYQQTVYSYVPNGDYPLNIDLQLSCKKRIAYERIINMMLDAGILNEVRLNGELIGEINTILAAHEFETQCLGCFVESRRQQMQTWAETIAAEWNQQVERITGKSQKNLARNRMFPKNAKTNRDASFRAHQILEEAIKSGEKRRSDSSGGIVLQESSVYAKMGELIEFDPKTYGKFLVADDVLTADGIENIRRFDDGNLFSLVKQRYGTASPKILQSFNPYNSEVLKLTFDSIKKMTGSAIPGASSYIADAQQNVTQADLDKINETIDKNYDGKNLSKTDRDALFQEMLDSKVGEDAIRQYMLDIGGNRIQSFSDFMIENVFDMLQIFHDFAIRDFSVHGYTKEQICLRLFGMTGAKWNGSWISHNEKSMGEELSGLMPYTAENAKHGITVEVDGEKYVIQFDDYERHTREKSFIQSIGFKDAIAIMLDPRYADNVGTITIGFSDKHIRAMLNSPYFRMVIPYHSSGMIPGFAELVGASTYNDYTKYQNTTPSIVNVYEDGKKVASYKFGEKKQKTGFYKDKNKFYVVHKGVKTLVKFDMDFAFNESLQRLGDARAAATEYVDWCRSEHDAEAGDMTVKVEYAPKFSNSKYGYDFTQERNYYKLLEDFNVYNSREEIINGVSINSRQHGVEMLYPGDENGTLSADQLEQYRKDLEQTGLFSAKEIDKYVKKAQMTFDELVKGEVEGRNAYYEQVYGKDDVNLKAAFKEISEVSLSKYKRAEEYANNVEEYKKSQKKVAKNNRTDQLKRAPQGTYGTIQGSDRLNALNDEYMKAVEAGDMDTAQKYVDEAAKEAGYVLSAYHGTGEYFNTFLRGEEGIHLGNESVAKQVAHSRYDIRSKNTRYDWETIKKDIPKMDSYTRWALVGQAYVLEDYYVDSDDESGKPFDGDINDDKAVLNYVENEVKKYQEASGHTGWNNVSFNLKTFDRKTGENVLHLYAKISNPFVVNGDVLQWSPDRIANILLARNKGETEMQKSYDNSTIDISGSDISLSAEHIRRLDAIANWKLKGDDAWNEIYNILTRHGYDGIKYLNQYEGDKKSYSYIALNPSDVKSADPVTYDDNGNVIPLTERFNKESEDIRYSSRDTAYLSAVESGDLDTAQKYVDEAAKKAGYTEKLFHGTDAFGFTVIDNNAPGADGYSFWAAKDSVTSATYTKYGRVREISKETDEEALEQAFSDAENALDDAIHAFRRVIDKHFTEWYFGQQNDQIIRDAVDEASDADELYQVLSDFVVEAWEKYGDELSGDYEDFADFQGSEIGEEIDDAISVVETKKMAYDKALQEYEEGAEISGGIYQLYANTDNMYEMDAHLSLWNNLHPEGLPDLGRPYKTRDVANWARENGYDGVIFKNIMDNGMYGRTNATDVYAFFKPQSQVKSADPVTYDDEGNVIPLSERFNPENEDLRFSYRDLANSESEIIINALKNDAALVDQLGAKQSIEAYAREYGRLKELESQQISLTKQLQKKDTTPSEREVILKKMVRLDRAILNKTTELTEMRNQRVIRDLLVNEWEKRDEMIAIGRAEERYQTRKVLEEKYGKELAEIRAKSKQKQQDIRDRHIINERKAHIIKKTKQLMDMCLHPTEKKKVPTILINPVMEMLDAIDYWTPKEGRPITKKSESLRERFLNFKEAINNYQKQIDEGTAQIEYMFDPEFLETIDDLVESVKGIENVNDMSAEAITDLDKTLTQMYHLINRGNKMITAAHFATVNEFVEKTQQAMDKRKTLSKKTSAKGTWLQRLNAGMSDTYAFGEYAGEGTRDIVDMLSKAFEDKESHVKEAIEFTKDVLNPYQKDLKKWSNETHDFTLSTEDKDGNPNKVSLTVGNMMELYLLNKREQARGHIYGGGIKVEDRKGRYTESVRITEQDVANIIRYLESVPGAIEVANALQKYGATTITGWGNQASNLMYGISKFTDENYWQIRSDSSALKDNENTEKALNASMYRLQNLGRTKAVKKGANNAIYIGDIFDTWSKTIDEMTSYASILPATTDAMRWWNSRVTEGEDSVRVKKLLESKLGTDMTKVFTDSIKALNGGIMGTDSLESLVKNLTGKAKAAAVAGNLRVVLQQPTAYTRAAAVIDPKYLMKALFMKPAAAEAQEHSSIAWHKAQGFYSNGLAPSLRKLVIGDASIGEAITEKSLWLAGKADDITWGALWNASKLKVEAENKALKKGSDAYWNEVNKVFSDIVNQTQVVDTPLTKSTWMRGNGLGVFFTAFMAEPTKTYSMVMERLDKVLQNPTSKTAWKAFGGVATVFAVNALVNAMAQALADAARDDDKEKDYWEKYIEKYKEDAKDNLNPITYIPVVKDIFSMWQGYSNNNLAMQAAQNSVYALQEIDKIRTGKSKKTLFGQAETIAKAISSWTGIPVGNAMRTLNSIGNVAGVDLFRRKKYTKAELGRNVVLSIREGNTTEATEYWNQLLREVGEDEISEAYGYISTYLAENDDNVNAYALEFLEDANNLERQAEDLMRKYEFSEYITLDVATDAIRKSARAYQKAEADASGEKYKQTVSSANSGGTIYNSSDVNRALEKGDISEAQKIIDKINKGYKEQESSSTAKSSVSSYWKPKYLAASGAERDRIARMLYKLKNNGKQMFSAKDLQKWVTDAKEAEKKKAKANK